MNEDDWKKMHDDERRDRLAAERTIAHLRASLAHMTDELYTALSLMCLNARAGLREIPSRARIHRELITSSTVNGKTTLEHAEELLAKYRAAHPEKWDADALKKCAALAAKREKLIPMSA